MYQLNQVPSECQVRRYLRRILFGKNIFCPECKSQDVICYETRYRCKSCRLKFSLLSHTWLAGMKLPYQKFWLILWCWTTQIPVRQAKALAILSEEAVRHWYDLFRTHLPENRAILSKFVQLDEAFFKSRALMMAKQKGTRNLAYEILTTTNVQRQHAKYFIENHIKPRTNLCTDGAGIYKTADQWWLIKHKADIHSKWQFGLTSEIEGAFGNLRTFIRRMYHHVTAEKLSEIVREFCYRFSFPEMFNNPRFYLEKSLKLVPFD